VLPFLLQGLTLGFSAAVQPGPFQAYLLSQTLKLGPRRALPLTLAPLFSDGPIIALILFLLVQMPAWLVRGLQVVGGLFLLYLAYRAFRSAQVSAALTVEALTARGPGRGLLESTLMNLLNPNPYLFWSLAGGAVLLEAWQQSPLYALSFLAMFYVTMIGGMITFIFVFAAAQRLSPRLTRTLNLAAALALAGFGLFQLWRGLTGT
jgi:threonine/homoserine/homoserine lactone efflux protein